MNIGHPARDVGAGLVIAPRPRVPGCGRWPAFTYIIAQQAQRLPKECAMADKSVMVLVDAQDAGCARLRSRPKSAGTA